MDELNQYLLDNAEEDLLPWAVLNQASKQFNLSVHEIEKRSLELNLLPKRYQRNRNMINVQQQLQLFNSAVAVIGCGGLGGYVIEELARLGIGRLIIIDHDIFEEHNLNRQILSSIDNLGKSKVEAAEKRIHAVNPAIRVKSWKNAFTKYNGLHLLQGADLVVDGLDSIKTRLDLADICNQKDLPLVHGSIAGWYGQISVQFPGDNVIKKIYANNTDNKGIESELGNPSFTPAFVASIEVAEVCKILLNKGAILKNKMLSINLLDMEFMEFPLN